eukprot:CAMPEP_0197635978 /NCGR_PEP_ID=MMETSP1338-20131121/11628_1 /TAXON_ID=43686 ORGANISM="Pelagodinium beii, Strain RCC1491" /NCGR_SAMPLE_ID=MMETSP1338 /ASSEMBLY_ACC=CAM_ASM_000754 /LENGTH=143 /DNA_ID=CAMNT_0043208123 /DNA_START=193 /DNA_END=621 /DNA_ORIENTATION=-
MATLPCFNSLMRSLRKPSMSPTLEKPRGSKKPSGAVAPYCRAGLNGFIFLIGSGGLGLCRIGKSSSSCLGGSSSTFCKAASSPALATVWTGRLAAAAMTAMPATPQRADLAPEEEPACGGTAPRSLGTCLASVLLAKRGTKAW